MGLPWGIDQKPVSIQQATMQLFSRGKPLLQRTFKPNYTYSELVERLKWLTQACAVQMNNEITKSGHMAIQQSDVQPFWAILKSRTITFSQYLQLPLSSSAVLAKLSRRQQRWERERSRTRMEKPGEPGEPGLLLLDQPMGCGIGWKEWRKYSYYWDVGLGVLDIWCILTMSSLVVAAAANWVSRDWENRQNRQLLCWLQQPAALGSVRVCCCSRARRKQPEQRAGCSHLLSSTCSLSGPAEPCIVPQRR